MARPKALVLRAAGTNCDAETAYALELCGARAEIWPLLPFLDRPSCLRDFQILAIPGGFSYGDDISAGRVFALEVIGRARAECLELVQQGGVILGICNGFQVLTEMGLLPGIEQPIGTVEVSLTVNDRPIYDARWVRLQAPATHCVFVKEGEQLSLPIAHAEGKLVPRDDQTLEALQSGKRIAVYYSNEQGNLNPPWPANPNGSVAGIAGLTDQSGRIFGLMPHPERAMFPFQYPTWTRNRPETADGLKIFQRGVEALKRA